MATYDLSASAAAIVAEIGPAVTAGLTIFVAVIAVRYIIKAFKAASNG